MWLALALLDFLNNLIVYSIVLPDSAVATTVISTSSWSFTEILFIAIICFPTFSPDFKVVYILLASIDKLTESTSLDKYSV